MRDEPTRHNPNRRGPIPTPGSGSLEWKCKPEEEGDRIKEFVPDFSYAELSEIKNLARYSFDME